MVADTKCVAGEWQASIIGHISTAPWGIPGVYFVVKVEFKWHQGPSQIIVCKMH